MASQEESFGGRAGEVVGRVVSPAALLGGVLVAAALAITGFILDKAGAEKAAPAAAAIVVGAFLARAAVDAYQEKWKSGRSVPLADVAPVALRYLALQAVVMAPVAFVGWRPDLAVSFFVTAGGNERLPGAFLALALYLACIVIAPPLLLIVAVAAQEFRDVVSPSYWRRCFASRGSDLFLIYVLYVGVMVWILILCVPVIAGSRLMHPRAAIVSAGLCALFAVGTSVLLLGQLCGEFARPLRPADPRTRIIVPPPVAARPAAVATPADPPPLIGTRKPPLLDGQQRLETIIREAGGNVALAVAPLERLRDEFAPNPSVMHALTISYARAGRADDALTAAREAIPLCLKSGSTILAAEIAVVLRDRMEAAGITPEQAVGFAEALRGARRAGPAAALYGTLLKLQPANNRVIKGALQAAQDMVAGGDARSSLALYQQLADCSAGTPLAEFVHSGRAEALRKAGLSQ